MRILKQFCWFVLAMMVQVSYAEPTRTISLQDAIYLAVRENPSVQQAQLNHVISKYSLDLQQWQFKPHFSFQATSSTNRNYSVTQNGYVSENSSGAQLGASWLSPIGTEVKIASNNNVSDHYNPELSLQIMQPLMRGFGKPIVEAALFNARDSEKVSRLNVEGTLRATITSVISAYLDVISAQGALDIDLDALKRANVSLEQTKLFIKAGHKAGVELVTVQAEVANAQTKIESDKNNLQQVRYALLAAIGIDPNSPVNFEKINVVQLIHKYHVPTLDLVKDAVLENDIQYQVDQITLAGATKRSLLQAENDAKWKLDLTVNSSTGGGSGGGQNSGVNSLVNGVNQTNSAMLTLTVPIDDHAAKTAIATAKIALQEAQIVLRQEKWSKETTAINTWNNIFSAERSLHFAELAEKLQAKTYQDSYKKYSYGLIDGLVLQTAQQQLVQSQRALVDARINYLKSLAGLDLLMGNTLKTWEVKVRYS